MSLVSIVDIHKDKIKIDTIITIQGWVRTRRDSKLGFSFIDIYDGSSCIPMQCIAFNTLKNYYEEILKLTIGCSITTTGILSFSKGRKQKYELIIQTINILGFIKNPENYPISSKKHTVEFLRNVLHLRSRTNFIGVVSRIRNSISYFFHDFLYKNGYFWIPTPIITSIDAEGSGKMFRLSTLDFNNIPKKKNGEINFNQDFFGRETFLTVSGQLTLEAYACALSKVYTFGPTFRAENSNTCRHLAEFWMLEVEKSFSDLEEISRFSEKMLKNVVKLIIKNCNTDIKFLENNFEKKIFFRLNNFLEHDFIRIDYLEAIDILSNSKQFKNCIYNGIDLSSEHEKYLINYYSNIPIIIKNFPKNLKAFYMRLNVDNTTVASFDILLPKIGEVIGGSEREERIDILKLRLNEMKLKYQDYLWYLDLRCYGTVPHAGFGLGFERFLSYITGISNVRDLIPFPRTTKNSMF